MADITAETESDVKATDSPTAVDGMVPPFLKKHVLTPQLVLAVIALAGVASIPLWHVHGPDVGLMASVVHFGGLAADANASDDKKEAPDPVTPTPFPKRRPPQTVHEIVPRLFAPTATPVAPNRNVTVPQLDVPQASIQNTRLVEPGSAAERLPSAVRGTFGDPSDGNADSSVAAASSNSNTNRSQERAQDLRGSSNSDQSTAAIGYVHRTSASELSEGAVIHCRWITHVDSEQAGHVSAEVIEPVYSSIDPRIEVIPAGAQLQGWYKTASSGQTRLLVAWNRINFPDGRKFEMGEEPGADDLGGTGVSGSVNTHLGKLFGQAALYTVLNAIGQALPRSVFNSSSITQTFSDQQPQIKPTIYVDSATRFDVNVVRDLPFDRYEVQG